MYSILVCTIIPVLLLINTSLIKLVLFLVALLINVNVVTVTGSIQLIGFTIPYSGDENALLGEGAEIVFESPNY